MSRVTLRNGFSYDCLGLQALDDAHTRLILSAEPNPSFVDVPTTAIAAVESLPAPPPPLQTAAAAVPPDIPHLLASAGTAHNLDVALLASIAHAESNGRARAISAAGARGVMQLMPGTAHQLGVRDSFEPEQNINGGAAYLDALLTQFHDNLALALAAYNAGPAAVERFHGIPPYRETQAYVVRVMTEFKRRKLALPQTSSRTLPASRE